jgi:negative regulator of sigma-B (phosphoserine phosphatase)
MVHEIGVGVSSRPHPHEWENGDAAVVLEQPGGVRIAVIDGLGHGHKARAASEAAIEVIRANPDTDAEALLHECHRALRPLRGAAICLASVDLERGRLQWSGVGNVQARLYSRSGFRSLLTDRGIVGSRMPTFRPIEQPLDSRWVLVVTTDGVRSGYDIPRIEAFDGLAAQQIADDILQEWARASDDATVVVVRSPAA